MSRAVVLCVLMLLVSVAHGGDLVTRFAYSQLFARCLGDNAYKAHLSSQLNATKLCFSEPIRMMTNGSDMKPLGDMEVLQDSISVSEFWGIPQDDCSSPVKGVASFRPGSCHMVYRRAVDEPGMAGMHEMQGPILESSIMKSILLKAASRISNYTCVLQKMGFVSDNFTLLFDVMIDQLKNVSSNAQKNLDFVWSIDYCRNVTMCLPEDPQSPTSPEIRQILCFFNCHKKLLLNVCMKYHILDFLNLFDVTLQPFMHKDENELATFMLNVFWGASNDDALDLY